MIGIIGGMDSDQQPSTPGNFQIPHNQDNGVSQTTPHTHDQPQPTLAAGSAESNQPIQPIQPIQQLAGQLQEVPPKAQEEALKESVLISRNPVAIIIRLMSLLVLLDLAFLVVVGALAFVGLGPRLIFLIFFIFLVIKIFALAFLVFSVLLPWANTGYYLTETHLERKRLNKNITTDEITYELRNIEGVRMHQGMLGRIFDYGDITLQMMTDKPKKIEIHDIKDPSHYKNVFDKYISVNI